jgi:hypothetical protein
MRRRCKFSDDTKGRVDRFWFCVVHKCRVSSPGAPCFMARYDGTRLERNPGRLPEVPPVIAREFGALI